MAFKQFAVAELGDVKIYKRRGSRNIRLSVSAGGEIRLTIPTWTPYTAGIAFANSKKSWILAQLDARRPDLAEGQVIGKAHRLHFESQAGLSSPKSRVQGNDIIVAYPESILTTHREVQRTATAASIRALRKQAEALLPQRLSSLADQHKLSYRSVRIKMLKSRWGSCDQDKNIVLNLFLLQLPWNCIDYVLLHELTHTKILHHGPLFWSEMERLEPRAKELKKLIRAHQPVIGFGEPMS